MANWRILSRSSETFADRTEAGYLLARELKAFAGENTVVLGVPRGGMAVAGEIARELNARLDIVLSRKLRSPGQPELAFGAISEDGHVSLNQEVVRLLDVSDAYIEQETAFQLAEIKRRNRIFREISPKVPLDGQVAIITDDGVATGATFAAALAAARNERPGKLIAALPVSPEDTVKSLARLADELICLRAPAVFGAVGQFYRDFQQLDDDDVLNILREGKSR
ncbi:putative phosphoribosyltransferase [Dehalogenimonas formicexedens]|uniref:Putative phosphoribosyltransferase n=1 Tax=Dehalogenimonas formicexedens TaxID=1839801 RepID=A0A1P8F694_9CHLR|nr:phosphoribosyltransferase family protein [Dehalogenimonas formicexedens]APV44006.1 putative phosphoribosyltransferase [Dehalogenimonas formicexedens]